MKSGVGLPNRSCFIFRASNINSSKLDWLWDVENRVHLRADTVKKKKKVHVILLNAKEQNWKFLPYVIHRMYGPFQSDSYIEMAPERDIQ